MVTQMRGVFAIPPTPFTPSGELDEPGLRSTLRFCLRAGVHGIVTPVNASEFTSLSDDERKRVVEIAVDEVDGAVPVVAGVAGTCLEHAVVFARHAREVGADSVIAMPPYARKATSQEIAAYYRAIAAAAQRPVWIQNHLPPIGTQMSPEFLADLVRDVEWVDYIKEECWPPGHYITAALERCGSKLKGVMGGMAGRYLLDEVRRGSCGTMPACEIADLHVALWERIETKDWRGARQLFNAILPLLNMEFMYGVAVYKEVLRRRGVITSTYMRPAGHTVLDAFDLQELDAILEELTPLFKV
ncbi:MAG TPA: dihydrodipicolinate synthase family protein [bacterium]|nr:dihydrodipicolinate synthase family protein [bacterium]